MGLLNFFFEEKKLEAVPARARPAQAKKPATTPKAPVRVEKTVAASGMQIAYSPELIPHLEKDHKDLLETFGRISKAFAGNDLTAVAKYLADFQQGILGHLMTENIKLYVYLGHILKLADPESFDLMFEFRREMYGIGKSVLAFLNKYREIGTQPKLAESFGEDLKNVGEILVARIKREEETLYPLYASNY
jgi:regulator of sigma D